MSVELLADPSWLGWTSNSQLASIATASVGASVAALGALFAKRRSRELEAQNERQIDELYGVIAQREAADIDVAELESRRNESIGGDVAGASDDPILVEMARRSALRSKIQAKHYADALRQSTVYFYISAVVAVVGFLLVVLGASLAFASLGSAGALTGLAGLVTDGAAALVFKQAANSKADSQRNLTEISEAAERDDNRQMARIYSSRIGDPGLRDATLAELARQSLSLSGSRSKGAGADLRPSSAETALPEVPTET